MWSFHAPAQSIRCIGSPGHLSSALERKHHKTEGKYYLKNYI